MGKEGNQAAVFSDYAICKFKDLRRALFWHGRGFSIRMTNFVYFNLYRSMMSSTTKYCLQFGNGFSGHQPVEGFLLSLYPVSLTTIMLGMMLMLDQDVSLTKYSESEEKMPFKLSKLYAWQREQQSRKRFYTTIVARDIYSIISGFIIFYVFYFSQGIMNRQG